MSQQCWLLVGVVWCCKIPLLLGYLLADPVTSRGSCRDILTDSDDGCAQDLELTSMASQNAWSCRYPDGSPGKDQYRLFSQLSTCIATQCTPFHLCCLYTSECPYLGRRSSSVKFRVHIAQTIGEDSASVPHVQVYFGWHTAAVSINTPKRL